MYCVWWIIKGIQKIIFLRISFFFIFERIIFKQFEEFQIANLERITFEKNFQKCWRNSICNLCKNTFEKNFQKV